MTGSDGATPPSHDPEHATGGFGSPQSPTADYQAAGYPATGYQASGSASWQAPRPADNHAVGFPAGPTPGSSSGMSGVSRLLPRQFVVPAAALAVAIIAVIASFVLPGGVVNRSSDSEVCSAYRAAERSWDSWDTDASEINELGSVARQHSDEDIRSAGERLDSLTGMFSYSKYASIVQPIQRLC